MLLNSLPFQAGPSAAPDLPEGSGPPPAEGASFEGPPFSEVLLEAQKQAAAETTAVDTVPARPVTLIDLIRAMLSGRPAKETGGEALSPVSADQPPADGALPSGQPFSSPDPATEGTAPPQAWPPAAATATAPALPGGLLPLFAGPPPLSDGPLSGGQPPLSGGQPPRSGGQPRASGGQPQASDEPLPSLPGFPAPSSGRLPSGPPAFVFASRTSVAGERSLEPDGGPSASDDMRTDVPDGIAADGQPVSGAIDASWVAEVPPGPMEPLQYDLFAPSEPEEGTSPMTEGEPDAAGDAIASTFGASAEVGPPLHADDALPAPGAAVSAQPPRAVTPAASAGARAVGQPGFAPLDRSGRLISFEAAPPAPGPSTAGTGSSGGPTGGAQAGENARAPEGVAPVPVARQKPAVASFDGPFPGTPSANGRGDIAVAVGQPPQDEAEDVRSATPRRSPRPADQPDGTVSGPGRFTVTTFAGDPAVVPSDAAAPPDQGAPAGRPDARPPVVPLSDGDARAAAGTGAAAATAPRPGQTRQQPPTGWTPSSDVQSEQASLQGFRAVNGLSHAPQPASREPLAPQWPLAEAQVAGIAEPAAPSPGPALRIPTPAPNTPETVGGQAPEDVSPDRPPRPEGVEVLELRRSTRPPAGGTAPAAREAVAAADAEAPARHSSEPQAVAGGTSLNDRGGAESAERAQEAERPSGEAPPPPALAVDPPEAPAVRHDPPAPRQDASGPVDTVSAMRQGPESVSGRGQPAPAPSPAYPPDETRVTHQIVRAARFLSRDGAGEVTLRLDPPDLGEVTIRILTDDRQLSGQIRVESRAIQDIVERHIGELRQALAGHGLDVRQLDVSVDDHGRAAQQREAFAFLQDRPHREGTSSGDRPRDNGGRPAISQTAPTTVRADGRVDFMA